MKKLFNNFELKLIAIIFPIMCILVFISVIARITMLFTEYLMWTEEAARYLMIWMAFLSIGVAARENAHFRMIAVVDRLPPNARKMVNLIADVISITFMCILVYYGFRMVSTQMRTMQLSPILKVPMWIPYLAIPFGILDMAVSTSIRAIKDFGHKSQLKEVSK